MDILRQHQGGNLDTLQLVQVGKQTDVQQDDQKAQTQTTCHTTAPRGPRRCSQAADDRQHGEAHGDIEGGIEQAAQGPVRHFGAEEGNDRHLRRYPVQLVNRPGTGDDGIHHDRQYHHQQEWHDGTDQVDDALDVETQRPYHQHRHQDGADQWIESELLGQGRPGASQHDHAYTVEEERQDQVDHKSRLLAEDDVQHLLVRAGLHDRTDAGDLHAQEGKQYRRHHGAGDAGQAITSEELQDLVAGGKATANDHGHIGQGYLQGMLVHLLIST